MTNCRVLAQSVFLGALVALYRETCITVPLAHRVVGNVAYVVFVAQEPRLGQEDDIRRDTGQGHP